MSSSVTLKIGQSVAVTANIVDGYGNPAPANQITWFSDSPAYVIVSNNSFVPGTENTVSTNTITAIANTISPATITCTVNGTVMNTVLVTVSSPAPTTIDFILGTPVP